MNITIPTRMEPYLIEFVADARAGMIKGLGDNPPQEALDQINALPAERIVLNTLKESLINWKQQKNAVQMRTDLNAANAEIEVE
jgi:hypothetical protein